MKQLPEQGRQESSMPKTREVSSFEVCKIMVDRNLDIRFAPIDNVTDMRLHRKKNTMVAIGVSGNVVGDIYHGKLAGGLLLFSAEQFQQIKKELESAAQATGEVR